MTFDDRKKPLEFENWAQYRSLHSVLAQSRDWKEIEVRAPLSNVGLTERWFQNLETSEEWRLIEPDPPFRGLWAVIE